MRAFPLRRRLYLLLAAAGALPLLLLPPFGLASMAVWWLIPAVLLGAYPLALTLAHPLEEVLDMARRIRGGDLKARAFLDQRDGDWAALAGTMADLADQLDLVTRTFEDEVSRRTAALARKADQLRAVGEVGRQVAAVLEPDALLHFVVRVMRGAFGYAVVAVLQRHGEHLVLTACAARGQEEVALGRVVRLTGAPGLSAHLDGEGGTAEVVSSLVSSVAAQSELSVPLRVGGRVLGLLVVQSLQANAFDDEDLFTVRTIAGQVAVALENARLFEAERRLRDLAVAEERNRMAREIHDTLAQGFMGIIMQLRASRGAPDPDRGRIYLEQAETLAQESLQEARRSVWNLRPHSLEDQGLAGALASAVQDAAHRAGAAINPQFTTEGPIEQIGPAAEAALLRIAQEALHNALKYAHPGNVSVRLFIADGIAELTIADDGVGFDPNQPAHPDGMSGGGTGLLGMAERAKALGGMLEVQSAPGQGCTVVARVPAR